jgi:hypothetical protein
VPGPRTVPLRRPDPVGSAPPPRRVPAVALLPAGSSTGCFPRRGRGCAPNDPVAADR